MSAISSSGEIYLYVMGLDSGAVAEKGGFEPIVSGKCLSLQVIPFKHRYSRYLEAFHKIFGGRRSLPGAVQ